MIDEIYGQMEKIRSPPTMAQFIDVYIEAVSRLEQKIMEKDERIRECLVVNDNINAQLNMIAITENEPNARKFVIRVSEINGVYCSDPLFKLTTDTNEVATVHFTDFTEGDVIISLVPENKRIEVEITNNQTNEPLHRFQINLKDFEDRQRQELEINGPGNVQPLFILYEGQLILNRRDYHQGFLALNRNRMEDLKQFKYQYQTMQDQLHELFKDAILRKSFTQVHQNTSKNMSGYMNQSNANPMISDRNDPINMKGSVVRNMQNSGLRIVTGEPNTQLNRSQQSDKPRTTDPYKKGYVAQGSGNVNWNAFVHILFYINIGMLAASFFVNWHRASFLSLIVAIVFLTWYLQKDEHEQLLPPLFLAIGYALALAFDLLWLIQDSRDVWSNGTWIHSGSLAGMDKFMVIMSYILLGTESAALIVSVLLKFTGMFKNPTDRSKKLDFQIKI